MSHVMADTGDSPVALLRQAESLIRERAPAATPGPWKHMCLGSEGCLVIRATGTMRERGQGRVARFGSKEWKADHADAAYVAAMHPVAALAVADWLGEVADDRHSSLPAWVETAALAVARAVLNGQLS
jgi:hypothetical protein